MKDFFNMALISILFFLMFITVFSLIIFICKHINPVFGIGFIILGILPTLIYVDGKDEDEYDIIGKIIKKIKGDKNDFFEKKK